MSYTYKFVAPPLCGSYRR